MTGRPGTHADRRHVVIPVKAAAAVVALLIAVMITMLALSTVIDPERAISPGAAISVPDPSSVYDPVDAGEPTPTGFRQVLPRDAIFPVYDPKFVAAPDAGWSDGDLVIGLEIGGESKAYPVGFLNRREMVVDRLSGIPVLVTW